MTKKKAVKEKIVVTITCKDLMVSVDTKCDSFEEVLHLTEKDLFDLLFNKKSSNTDWVDGNLSITAIYK